MDPKGVFFYTLYLAVFVIIIKTASFLFKISKKESRFEANIKSQIAKLDKKASIQTEDALRSALIGIDTILDAILKQKNAAGSTLGERLKSSKHLFKSTSQYNSAWKSHKLRNRLVHEIGYNPRKKLIENQYNNLKSICNYLLE